jgi:hypothetical protein
MTERVTPPTINAYEASHLPPMEFSGIFLTLLLTPVLFFIGKRLVELAKSKGHTGKIWPTLVALSAVIMLLSAAKPVANYLWYFATVNATTYVIDDIAWAPAIALSSLLCALPISCLLVAAVALRQQVLATTISCAMAMYYIAFPFVFTEMQSRGLLGPGLREIVLIVLAALLFVELRSVKRKASYAVIAALVVTAFVSASSSVRWFNYIASLEFSSVRF